MKRRTGMLLLTALLLSSCFTVSEASYMQKIENSDATTYEMKEEALSSLRLPVEQISRENIVAVRDYPERNILEISIGPVDLEAGQHHMRLPIHATAFPFEAWLHGFDWGLEDGDGRKLPAELLHHVNLIQPDRREVFYPIARRLFAAGRETKPVDFPSLIGVPVQTDSPLLILVMFASPGQETYRNVRLRLMFRYSRPEDRFIHPKEVVPFYLDTQGPVGTKSFPVPPGVTVKSGTASPLIDGRILGIGGHLHDYGEYVALEDATKKEMLWKGMAEKEENGHVTAVETDVYLLPWRKRIFQEHSYRIISEYYNPHETDTPDGGMGEIGGVFVPAPGTVENWDKADYEDQVYQEDLTFTIESTKKEMHGDMH